MSNPIASIEASPEQELSTELSSEQISAIVAGKASELEAEETLANALTAPSSDDQLREEFIIDDAGRERREKLKDLSYLPTREELYKALNLKNTVDVSRLGEGVHQDDWLKFCAGQIDGGEQIFELYTEEYIERLADNLIDSARKFGASLEKPLQVVELGAGNGKLSHFLQETVNRKEPGLIIVRATDLPQKGEWQEGINRSAYSVEPLSHEKALEKYKPDIVIVSWMPPNFDMTAAIRNAHVKQYILIGVDQGCGEPSWTWGRLWLSSDTEKAMWQDQQIESDPMIISSREVSKYTGHISYNSWMITPYQVDGYSRRYNQDLSKLSISRTGGSEVNIFTMHEDFSDAERRARRQHYIELLNKYQLQKILSEMPKEFAV